MLLTEQAHLNLDEEHLTLKGDTRLVRVYCQLSRETPDALSASKSTPVAQRRKSEGHQDGSLYHTTPLWQ